MPKRKQAVYFSDEEKLFGVTETQENGTLYITQEYLSWEEFANVATNLLEKIEHFLDTLDDTELDLNDSDALNTTQKDSSTNISFSAW